MAVIAWSSLRHWLLLSLLYHIAFHDSVCEFQTPSVIQRESEPKRLLGPNGIEKEKAGHDPGTLRYFTSKNDFRKRVMSHSNEEKKMDEVSRATKDLSGGLHSISTDVFKSNVKLYSPLNGYESTTKTERHLRRGISEIPMAKFLPESRSSKNGYIHSTGIPEIDQGSIGRSKHEVVSMTLKDTHADFNENDVKKEEDIMTTLFEYSETVDSEYGSRDYFECPPCSCYHIPAGNNANCSSSNFSNPVTGVPNSLPLNVKLINMSYNSLEIFDFESIATYTDLVMLNLTNNKIHTLNGKVHKHNFSNLKALTLDYNYVSEIVDDNFCFTPKLKILTMSNNKIRTISNSAFRCLFCLSVLDLSFNTITLIGVTAFDTLNRLSNLKINNNPELGYSIRLKTGVLRRLTTLKIQGNSADHSAYPKYLFSSMIKVRRLTIDGLGGNGTLGPSFRKLKLLQELSFGPNANCNFKYLPPTFFQNCPALNYLSFDHCDFTGIDPEAFRHIPKLGVYRLAYIKSYDLDEAFQSLQGFQNSSLHSLSFVGLYHRAPICRTLTSAHGRYLKGLTTLDYLDLSNNRLALLRDGFLKSIPTSLRRLILVGNKFTITTSFVSKIDFLSSLMAITITNQIREDMHEEEDDDYDQYYQHSVDASEDVKNRDCYTIQQQNEGTKLCSSGNINQSFTTILEDERYLNDNIMIAMTNRSNSSTNGVKMKTKQKTKRIDGNDNSHKLKKSVELPPNLRSLSASQYPFFAEIILFRHVFSRNLNTLVLTFNFMQNWGDGQLPASVEYAYLGYNHGETLSDRFFHVVNNLRILYLEHNALGSAFASDENGSLLAHLYKLDELNIPSNKIFTLPWQFFKGLYSLRKLQMSDNKISRLHVKFSHMTKLSYIDVSKNSISWISRRTRNDLDSMASRGKIVLDLTFNPLPCTCSGIEILDWISSTKVYILSRQYLTCLDEDGKLIRLRNIEESTGILKRQCASYPVIIIGCCCGFLGLFLALLTSALVYRLRWRLLYTINNGFFVKLFGFKLSRKKLNGFKFDAYVVYDEEDRDFVLNDLLEEMESKRRHKLCVEDRDFLPGTFMFHNTNSAVQNSATTVFVVSEDFVQSKEYEYALQVALLEEYYSQGEKREVCLLLMYGNITRAKLPKDMQMLMMKGRFLSYPSKDEAVAQKVYQGFWDRLSNSIGFATTTARTDQDE